MNEVTAQMYRLERLIERQANDESLWVGGIDPNEREINLRRELKGIHAAVNRVFEAWKLERDRCAG